MIKEKKRKLNIWWKLAVASAFINIISFPFWILLRFADVLFNDEYYFEYAHYSFLIVCWLCAIPIIYFGIFCIWHWRTRYKGKNPIAWPIFTVLTYWPGGLTFLPGSFFVAIVYFFMHIIPDIRNKGPYSEKPSELEISHSVAPLPKKYKLAKGACFVTGWALIILGLYTVILSTIAHFTIWDIFAQRIPHLVGEKITHQISKALLLSVDVSKISVVSSVLCAFLTVIGAIFIQVSQKLRWRLLEEEEKEELRKSFNKKDVPDSDNPSPEI